MVILAWIVVGVLLVPTLVLAVECFSAFLPERGKVNPQKKRPNLAILIPAHNEGSGIAETLASVISQIHTGDRILVVADNCSDDTAAIALAAGASVIERDNSTQLGKGFALAYGLDELSKNPPDVLIMLDADCLVMEDTLTKLAVSAGMYDCPVQSLYLMHAGIDAPIRLKVAEFAWVVKNHVRALGLFKLHLPCQLMGTGMAFPWHIISKVDLATDAIVEDMQLGVELATRGHETRFCPDACVTSCFPMGEKDAGTQRRRWEHGHLEMITRQAPRLLIAALRQRSPGLFFLVLDLMVPPVALYCLIMILALVAFGCSILWISAGPFFTLLTGGFIFGLTLICVRFQFARHIIGWKECVGIPMYVLSKVGVYIGYIWSKESKWVRTGRDSND